MRELQKERSTRPAGSVVRAIAEGAAPWFVSRRVAPFIRTVPWRELGRQGAAQIGWEQLTRDEDALFSLDAVYRSLDRRVAQEVATGLTIKAIYADYDESFRRHFAPPRNAG